MIFTVRPSSKVTHRLLHVPLRCSFFHSSMVCELDDRCRLRYLDFVGRPEVVASDPCERSCGWYASLVVEQTGFAPSHHSSLLVRLLSWASLCIPIASLGIYYCSPPHSTEQLIPIQLVAFAFALVSLGTLRGWRSFDVLITAGLAIPLALTVAYQLIFANMRIWQ